MDRADRAPRLTSFLHRRWRRPRKPRRPRRTSALCLVLACLLGRALGAPAPAAAAAGEGAAGGVRGGQGGQEQAAAAPEPGGADPAAGTAPAPGVAGPAAAAAPEPAPATAAAATAPAAAPGAAEPRFLIEKISVAGVRRQATRNIVITQSYLRTGKSYSERELQEAVYRVKRLPFVVEAEAALRKGSERGRYELVLTVEETRPLFLDNSVTGTLASGNRRVQGTDAGTLAVREFIGASGFAFASFSTGTNQVQTWQAGYTAYGIFGGNSYAGLVAAYGDGGTGPLAEHSLSFSGSMALSLSSNLMLIASPGWSRTRQSGGVTIEDWNGSLALVYRTTDDPIIPTNGADVELSALVDHSTADFLFLPFGLVPFVTTEKSLSFVATNYWPITRRQSVGASVSASGTRESALAPEDELAGTPTVTGEQGGLNLIYSASLWGDAATRRLGDLRLEASIGYSVNHSSAFVETGSTFVPFGTSRQESFSIGVVFRDPWAILRFNFAYFRLVSP